MLVRVGSALIYTLCMDGLSPLSYIHGDIRRWTLAFELMDSPDIL